MSVRRFPGHHDGKGPFYWCEADGAYRHCRNLNNGRLECWPRREPEAPVSGPRALSSDVDVPPWHLWWRPVPADIDIMCRNNWNLMSLHAKWEAILRGWAPPHWIHLRKPGKRNA